MGAGALSRSARRRGSVLPPVAEPGPVGPVQRVARSSVPALLTAWSWITLRSYNY